MGIFNATCTESLDLARPANASNHETAGAKVAALAQVERDRIENDLTLSGEFRPYQQVDVHAKVAGYIRKIYVDVGDDVKRTSCSSPRGS
jgi:multidrug efflux pump subunit AcrA (membrane-fusion protein)